MKDSLLSRRDFLSGLKKWSKVVIAAAVVGNLGSKALAGTWVNRRGSWSDGAGGGWYNSHYGGGSWVNSDRGGWVNRPISWGNGSGGWYNAHQGGSWVNSDQGGWINRRGLGGWINKY